MRSVSRRKQLKHSQVLEISKDTRPAAKIAAEYEITVRQVRNIRMGRTHSEISGKDYDAPTRRNPVYEPGYTVPTDLEFMRQEVMRPMYSEEDFEAAGLPPSLSDVTAKQVRDMEKSLDKLLKTALKAAR